MRVIRQILLTEYIGAILVAVLVADAFTTLITTAVAQISYYVRFGHDIVVDTHRLSATYAVLAALTRVALYLVSAYLVARWLYPSTATESRAAENKEGA